jgi:hypothetical protein
MLIRVTSMNRYSFTFLSSDEAQELGVPTIDAVALGKKVVEFWRQRVSMVQDASAVKS